MSVSFVILFINCARHTVNWFVSCIFNIFNLNCYRFVCTSSSSDFSNEYSLFVDSRKCTNVRLVNWYTVTYLPNHKHSNNTNWQWSQFQELSTTNYHQPVHIHMYILITKIKIIHKINVHISKIIHSFIKSNTKSKCERTIDLWFFANGEVYESIYEIASCNKRLPPTVNYYLFIFFFHCITMFEAIPKIVIKCNAFASVCIYITI